MMVSHHTEEGFLEAWFPKRGEHRLQRRDDLKSNNPAVKTNEKLFPDRTSSEVVCWFPQRRKVDIHCRADVVKG